MFRYIKYVFFCMILLACDKDRFRKLDDVPFERSVSTQAGPVEVPVTPIVPPVDYYTQKKFSFQYDFLWVVDNSRSMKYIRDFMKDNLKHFITVLESRRQIDWQMAVTITDHAVQQGNLIEGKGKVKVISKGLADAGTLWGTLIDNIQNTKHSYWEQGLESAHAAIENFNHEFSRPGVPLVVVYVTDEQDYSCESNCNKFKHEPEELSGVNYFSLERYLEQFKSYSKKQGAEVLAFPMVNLKEPGKECKDPNGSIGYRYMTLQQKMGVGESVSLCSQNIPASFERIARITADRGVCFKLSYEVTDALKFQVRVNGSPVGYSKEKGFYYEPENKQICFAADAIPGNGSQIEVRYYTGASQQIQRTEYFTE